MTDQSAVTEYGTLMSGGGFHVRASDPDIERIYPLAQWITDKRSMTARVYRRRVIAIEDWIEVTEP